MVVWSDGGSDPVETAGPAELGRYHDTSPSPVPLFLLLPPIRERAACAAGGGRLGGGARSGTSTAVHPEAGASCGKTRKNH